jgi:hypothetical protein
MTAYEIRRVESGAREDLFVNLRRDALGEEATSPALFRWQYQEAPDGDSEALVLESRGVRGREPVGWTAVQERRLLVDGRERSAGLLVNLVVVEGHRTVLPALMLQRAARAVARERFELSYGYPNRAALGGFLRAGYHHLGDIRRHACVLGAHGDKLAELGMWAPAAAAVGQAADAVSPLVRRALWAWGGRRYDFEWPANVDRRFDRLWSRAAAARPWQVMSRRNARFVQWRLSSHPKEPFAVGALVERSTGELVAYAALRQYGMRAHIADLFAADEEALGPVLDGVLEALVRMGVTTVDFCHLGHARVVEMLRLRGFQPREAIRHVIVDPASLGPSILDPERWHLTDVDGDL